MIETAHNTFMFRDGAAFIICDQARACGCCHRAALLFINRLGKTLCIPCDAKRLEVAATERAPGDEPTVEQTFSGAIV